MLRTSFAFISILLLFLSLSVQANNTQNSELQGYGAFSNLNKIWMLMALYSEMATETNSVEQPQRLEIKIATKKISSRRFRSLWLETLAVEHGTSKVAAMQSELKQFFNILKGPLQQGDSLIIERTESASEVRINYHTLVRLSRNFLPTMVQSLVGKHPPTQALKAGLMGREGLREQTNLSIHFERLEPTLPRIAEISRWGKQMVVSIK
jgi:hypothetical protein